MSHEIRKVHVVTQGCDMNRVDGQYLANSLPNTVQTDDKSNADIVIVQTCALSPERAQAFHDEMAALQRDMPGAEIIVGGCLNAAQPGGLKQYGGRISRVENPASLAIHAERYPAQSRNVPWVAHFEDGLTIVRVSTGCLEHCSYCAIWKASGRTRSRPAADIVRDIAAEVARGNTTIRITSEDCGAWGQDSGSSLAELLTAIRDARIENAHITLGTLHPRWLPHITPSLVDAIEAGVLEPVLQVPIQSGSSRILRLMKRDYRLPEVYEALVQLRARVSNLQLFTDVIVGFPTETDDDLAATIAFLKAIHFTEVYILGFNPQMGTEGATLPGKIDRKTLTTRVGVVVTQLLLQDFLASGLTSWTTYVNALATRSRPRPAMFQSTWLTDTLAFQEDQDMHTVKHSKQFERVMTDSAFALRAAKREGPVGDFARDWISSLPVLENALTITAVQIPEH